MKLEGLPVLAVNFGSRNDVGFCVYSKSMRQFKVYFYNVVYQQFGCVCMHYLTVANCHVPVCVQYETFACRTLQTWRRYSCLSLAQAQCPGKITSAAVLLMCCLESVMTNYEASTDAETG